MIFHYYRGLLGYYWIYQTHLNLLMTVVTMLIGAMIVTRFQWTYSKSAIACDVFDLFWHHSMCWAFCVTGFYWIKLHGTIALTVSNILAHGTNSLIFMLDFCVLRCAARFRTFAVTMIYTTIYLIFTFVYANLGGVNK